MGGGTAKIYENFETDCVNVNLIIETTAESYDCFDKEGACLRIDRIL